MIASISRRFTRPSLYPIVLLALFIMSGGAGLIYETLWARYLGLLVGHTAYAQILVLAIFLGGMSGGALYVSTRSERMADPLLWYARIELAIGVIGIFFHEAFNLTASAAYDHVFPLLGGGMALQAGKWVISGALILPQSVLLGATFPLMSAGVLRRLSDRPGRTLSLLYFANSFGAAVSVLIAGFLLLAQVGLPGTLLVAAGLNIAVALAAFLVARDYPVVIDPSEVVPTTPTPSPATTTDPATQRLRRLLMAVAFGTAVASFIYEIGWIRMLSLVLGSATHSFELMLSAFIFGMACGSFWAGSRMDRWRAPERALALVQWAMGAAAIATLPLYAASFGWMSDLMATFARTEPGYAGFSMARYGLCLVIMVPSTFCAGVTLPLITRILVVRGIGERAIGHVYGINTLGSIIGVVLAGLVLMPWIGVRGLIVAGATLDMALGVALLFHLRATRPVARPLALGATAATAVIALLGAFAGEFDPQRMFSGVYQSGQAQPSANVETVFWQDGRTATVSVQRFLSSGSITIATNGKADASLPGYWFDPCTTDGPKRTLTADAPTQLLGPMVALAHAPRARRAAVIGQGSGMSSHFVLGSSDIEELVTIEIEPAMTRGSRYFYPQNRRVFDDPRSRIVTADARSYFAASPRQFDFMFSEPSNPWVSGVSSLFTSEFYRRVSENLTDDGVFGQWLHLYNISDGLVLSILAAMHQHFGSYTVFLTNDVDIVIVASNSAELPAPDWSVLESPAIAEDLCNVHPLTPRMLEASRLVDGRALEPILAMWPQPNSDFFPVLDLGAERTRFLGRQADGFRALSGARFDFPAALLHQRSLPTDEGLAPVPAIPRSRALALLAQLSGATPQGVPPDPLLQNHRYRVDQWRTGLTANTPPADWPSWLADFRVVEAIVHGGTLGYVDREFYEGAWQFLQRFEAPDIVQRAVRFDEALAGFEFAVASQAADGLLESVLARQTYVEPDELLDGAVVAKLRTGDPAGARRIFDALLPLSQRDRSDLRLRMLEAFIVAMEDGR